MKTQDLIQLFLNKNNKKGSLDWDANVYVPKSKDCQTKNNSK